MITTLKFKTFSLRHNSQTGYICANDVGNSWHKYSKSKSYYAFIRTLSTLINVPRYKLVKRDKTTRITWIHPKIATHMSSQSKPHLSAFLSVREDTQECEKKIDNTPVVDAPVTHDEHRKYIAKIHSGITEIICEAGIVDVFSDTDICVVNVCSKWKKALGEIIAYSVFFPNHNKFLYLYDAGREKTELITKICESQNILLKFLS